MRGLCLFVPCVALVCAACGPKPSSASPPVAAHEVLERFDRFLHASLSEQARLADELERLGSSAAPYLEVRLRSTSDFGEHTAALMILQRLNARRRPGDFSEAQVREYLAWLQDGDVVVRTYAMESLIQAGRGFRPLVETAAAHADPVVREKLAIVLREMR